MTAAVPPPDVARARWHTDPPWQVIIVAVVIATMALMLGGCAPGVLGAKQAVSAAERASASSLRAFGDLDASRQSAIVAEAAARSDPAWGRHALDEYRARRGGVLVAIAALDAVIAGSRAAIVAVDAGGRIDLAPMFVELARVVAELAHAIQAIASPPPGTGPGLGGSAAGGAP